MFRTMEFAALGDSSFCQHEQAIPITYELERAFCAAAWISVVLLSHCLVDMYFNERGLSDQKVRKKKMGHHTLWEELEWLRNKRNPLVHRSKNDAVAVSSSDQWFNREQLFEDAKRAVSIAFQFTLEPSRSTVR